jgi:hypothetical protein
MFHANTQSMIEYWTARARNGLAPSRGEIDPNDFRQLLPHTFVLGHEGRGDYRVRLAGGFVRELHRRDLRGQDALALWSGRDRLRLQGALENIRARPEPLVTMAEALTDGPSLSLEVLFAPLAAHDGGPDRFLGLYQPLGMISRLQGRAALELSVRALRRAGGDGEEIAPIRLAAVGGLRTRHAQSAAAER